MLAFFLGGTVFITFEYVSARRPAATPAGETNVASLGLYVGILVDLAMTAW